MPPLKKGGKSSRLGEMFYREIESLKDARLRNGKSKERVSTEKITNLIVRHKGWKEIAESIIEAKKEEIDKYGL